MLGLNSGVVLEAELPVEEEHWEVGLLLDFYLVSDEVLDERAEVAWLAGGLGVRVQVVACFVSCLHQHVHGLCLGSVNLLQTFHRIAH